MAQTTVTQPHPAPGRARGRNRGLRRADRIEAILDELTRHGTLLVQDLSARFGVSEATLRRDLALLEEQHLLTRTHGGALAPDAGYELPARQRKTSSAEVNRAIGRLAAQRLPDGAQVVAFTGGPATAETARQLGPRADLTVVTTNLQIAIEATNRPLTRLIVVGGATRPGSQDLSGLWAEEMVASLNIGTLYVSAEGVSARGGLTTDDDVAGRTTAALLGRAERVVVLAPGEAVGRVALSGIAPVTRIDEVITDTSAPGPALAELRDAGVAIGLVDPQPR